MYDNNAITWVHPGAYPSRCSPDRAQRIAETILEGVTPKTAAMAEGVMPQRLRQWLEWGLDAYNRDAGPQDSHAEYLNLYLKVGQAVGIAAAINQRRVFRQDARFWLLHHPEIRGEWGELPSPDAIMQFGTPVEALPAPALTTDGTPEGELPALTNQQLVSVMNEIATIREANQPRQALTVVEQDPPASERQVG